MNRVSGMNGISQVYSPAGLSQKYGLGIQEAKRLLCCFDAKRTELDRLLAGVGRTASHRQEEFDLNSTQVAFGVF